MLELPQTPYWSSALEPRGDCGPQSRHFDGLEPLCSTPLVSQFTELSELYVSFFFGMEGMGTCI